MRSSIATLQGGSYAFHCHSERKSCPERSRMGRGISHRFLIELLLARNSNPAMAGHFGRNDRSRLLTRPPILSIAPPRLQLAAPESIRRDCPPSRDPNYKASNQRDDQLRGSAENCRCEFSLRGRRCQSGPGAAHCIFRLLRAAFAPAVVPARSTALFLCS